MWRVFNFYTETSGSLISMDILIKIPGQIIVTTHLEILSKSLVDGVVALTSPIFPPTFWSRTMVCLVRGSVQCWCTLVSPLSNYRIWFFDHCMIVFFSSFLSTLCLKKFYINIILITTRLYLLQWLLARPVIYQKGFRGLPKCPSASSGSQRLGRDTTQALLKCPWS